VTCEADAGGGGDYQKDGGGGCGRESGVRFVYEGEISASKDWTPGSG